MAYLTSDQSGAVQRILESLGLAHRDVHRITIVIDCNAVPQVEVYVRRTLHEEEADAIADSLPKLDLLLTVSQDPV